METVAAGSFAIAGATLAQIMHDVGSVEGDCDGILFGRLQRQTKSSIQDDEAGPPLSQELITARVTGYYCSGRVQSFYDSTGRLNRSKLSNIVKERQGRGEDPLIGWYLGRRNSSLWPSMREAAVTSYLRYESASPSTSEEANVVSPSEQKGLQIGSVGAGESSPGSPSGGSKRRTSVSTSEVAHHQIGRLAASPGAATKPALLSVPSPDSPGSPSMSASPSKRRTSSLSPQQQEKRIEPSAGSKAPPPPRFFVLFTESDSLNNPVRTHEYRAFQFLHKSKGISFEPLPVTIVNAGVAFRGVYESFVPVAAVPSWFQSEMNLGAGMAVPATQQTGSGRGSSGKAAESSIGRGGRKATQDFSDSALERLSAGDESAIGAGTFRVTPFEKSYQQMLSKLERLSSEVHESSMALQQWSRASNNI